MKELIHLMKLFKWEMQDRWGRYIWLNYIIRSLPGEFGIYARYILLKKYFKHCGKNVMIHPGVYFRGIHEISVGNNVGIGNNSFIQASGGLEIGDNASLGPGVKIWTQNHKFEKTGPVNDRDYEYKKVIISKDVWIGANAFIMPGAEIGEGAIISACSVVGGKKIPPYSIVGGHPARVIGQR